jgi:ABC-2 type transport system ATP-binding protein
VPEAILSIQNLTKHFGPIKAVNGLSLEVGKGDVFGILGPNGSGKTTTLGMILNVVNPTAGSFTWFGLPPSHHDRKRIGAILEQPLFYPYLSPLQNLRIIALIKEVDVTEEMMAEQLRQVGLYDRRHSRFSTFSYGMKQRMALAAALLCKPEVLILDEPTNGLDPQGIAEVRQIIHQVASQGVTIILASHLLDEVQKTCSHVCVLDKGYKLYAGSVEEVLRETVMAEIAAPDMEKLSDALGNTDIVSSFERHQDMIVVKLANAKTSSELNAYLFSRGIVLSHLVQKKKSLENYFLELVNKNK